MGKTHAIAGSLLVAAAAPPVNEVLHLGVSTPELAIGVGIGAIAGVLPDIDHPDSFITHGVIPGERIFGPVGKAIGYLACIPPRIVGVPARATMNHRGGTHSVVFMIGWTLLAAPIYALVFSGFLFLASIILGPLTHLLGVNVAFDPGSMIQWIFHHLPSIMPLVMLSVFFGYLAHLLTDSMTNVPVPWPWPFSKKRYSILPKGLRITTDSFIENHLIRPIFLLLLIAVFAWNIGVPIGTDLFGQAKAQIENRDGSGNRTGGGASNGKVSIGPARALTGKH